MHVSFFFKFSCLCRYCYYFVCNCIYCYYYLTCVFYIHFAMQVDHIIASHLILNFVVREISYFGMMHHMFDIILLVLMLYHFLLTIDAVDTPPWYVCQPDVSSFYSPWFQKPPMPFTCHSCVLLPLPFCVFIIFTTPFMFVLSTIYRVCTTRPLWVAFSTLILLFVHLNFF